VKHEASQRRAKSGVRQFVLTVCSTSGAGGYAEVSGKQMLDFSGSANLKANVAVNGTLLRDPADVTISGLPTLNATLSGGIFSPDSGVSTANILNTALQAALALGNVIVTTTNSGTSGSGNGDITVNARSSGPATRSRSPRPKTSHSALALMSFRLSAHLVSR